MHEPHIRGMLATIDAREWEALATYLHPDVTYARPGYPPLEGRDAVLHFYRQVRIIASGVHHLHAFIAEGAHAASFGRFVGADRQGVPLDEEFAEHYEFEDGLLRRRTSYFFRPAI